MEIDSKEKEIKRSYLKQKQALPLEDKIKLAKMRIREWYEYWDGDVYISFSGGKDSTVLRYLVKEVYPDVPAVFVDTGLEYPEVRAFARENADIVLKPKRKFNEILATYGYPIVSKEVAEAIEYGGRAIKEGRDTAQARQLLGDAPLSNNGGKSMYDKSKWKYLIDADFKITAKCCYHMKKSPFKKFERESGRHPITGVMADESQQRRTQYLRYGCNVFDSNHPISKPLSVWKEQDVLEFLVRYEIPYASPYGEIKQDDNGKYYCTGLDRTGCIFCAFGAHLEKEPNRFQRLKVTHPKLYNYCIGGLLRK